MGKTTRLTTEEFISKAKQIHNDKYDYSNVNYVNKHTKVCIVCPEHGEFWQSPNNHLSGNGCPKCWKNRNFTSKLSNTSSFIERAIGIHNNKYDYSKVNYTHSLSKVCIVCPKHGEFWQTPNMHLHGQGCPKCKQSKLENEIEIELKKNNIKFDYRKHPKWLKGLELDFYLPEYNIAIECQGIEHFEPRDFFGGEQEFKNTTERDIRKQKLCEENGIKLLYYTSDNLIMLSTSNEIYKNKLFSNILEMLKNIK